MNTQFNTHIKLHSLFATILSLSCFQLLLNHSQQLIERSVMGVVHEHLDRKLLCSMHMMNNLLFTSHKSWMNHDPFFESLHDTFPGMVL